MDRSTCFKALALVFGSSISAAGSAATLYTQAYDGTGSLQASQNDTGGGNGNFATVYDNFTLAAAATVTGLSFTGGYFNPPTPGDITGFTVKFYANNGGQPGATISTTSVNGKASENCGGGNICSYSLALNFAAAGGSQYWMSIVPDVAFPPQWGWAHGVGGDGVSYQDFFGSRNANTFDLAFTLTGNAAVPEPAAWAMMITGFGLAGLSVRRSAKVNASFA